MRSTDALLSDPDFMTANQPNDADLERWVAALREGDFTYRADIIKGHMRLARSIGKTFGRGIRDDDCIGEAFLALTQAVEWSGPHVDDKGDDQLSRLTDNNITPYICTTIRSALSDFVATDRICGMPGRTFRAKAAKGEISSDGQNEDGTISTVFKVVRLVLADTIAPDASTDIVDHGGRRGNWGEMVNGGGSSGYTVPEAKQEEPSIEFTEALELAIHTDTERRIIDLRAQSYGYQEIGGIVNLGTSQIGRHVNRVEERFRALYG